MRTLTSTLTAAQKVAGNALWKAVFTKAGQTTRTYGVDTANIAIRMAHREAEWSQTADVIVENGDGSLTALDLTGYTATLSYGYNTSAGDEYSATAPLEVIAQQGVTNFLNGNYYVAFSCAGVFNMMGEDEASTAYNPDNTNTDTVKTILTAIANATMACFSHCKNWTITFDSEDSLIDAFIPADYFSVSPRESRLSAFKKALAYTKCKARIEANGAIHVFNPTISGTTYAYEYNDSVTEHNFFEKSVRNRLVIPNKITVASLPEQGTYTGNATDATSYAALGRYKEQFRWYRVTSDAQAEAIATAILQGYQVGQESGHGNAPMNCGQEVMDYVKITDSAANDTRTGNIGFINRVCSSGKFDMEFRFGDPSMGSIAGILPPSLSDLSDLNELAVLKARVDELELSMTQLLSDTKIISLNQKTMWDYLMNGGTDVWFRKLTVQEQLIIPTWLVS